MFLNYEEIVSREDLIGSPISTQFSNASYNLTVKYIIDMDGKKVEGHYRLKPQGMVYVVFNERIKMPPDLMAFAHVKTTLTKRGIMATNIGIIDPNYEGLISTLLINFGRVEFPLTQNDAALRITFAEIKPPSEPLPVNGSGLKEDTYVENIKKDIVNLDEKFLNLNKIETDVIWNLLNKFFKMGAVFGLLSLAVAATFNVINYVDKDKEKAIKKYELDIQLLEEKNKLTSEKLFNAETELKKKDTLLQKQIINFEKQLKEFKANTDKRFKELANKRPPKPTPNN